MLHHPWDHSTQCPKATLLLWLFPSASALPHACAGNKNVLIHPLHLAHHSRFPPTAPLQTGTVPAHLGLTMAPSLLLK